LIIEAGDWEYSELYRDVHIAHEWGFKDPAEFWKLSKTSRTIMTAYIEASGAMSSYDMQSKKK